MRYFRLIPEIEVDYDGPFDHTGRYFPVNGPHSWEAVKQQIRIVESDDDNARLGDFIGSMGPSLYISAKCRQTLKGVIVDPALSFIPTAVLDADGALLAEYWCIDGLKMWESLDYDRSEIRFIGNALYQVKRWVVHRSRLPTLDLFRIELLEWACTERLVEMFTNDKIENCKFEELEVS